MALPKRSFQVLRDRSGFFLELPPGNAHRPPAFGHEDAIPLTVTLELLARAVDATAVELHRHSMGLPERVDLEEPPANRQVHVHSRPAQVKAIDERYERLLKFISRDPNRTSRIE